MGSVRRLARCLFRAGRHISRDQARELAHAECVRRGIFWSEPVKVHGNFGDWRVWTNADHIGGNITINIDAGSGMIKCFAGPTPR